MSNTVETNVRNTVQKIETELTRLRKEATATGRNLWLAGLGTLAKVDEGRKSLFDDLVARGLEMEKRSKKAVNETLEEASAPVKEISGKVEEQVEEKVASTMKRFGIPSRKDLDRLNRRLDALSKKIDAAA